MPYVFEIDHHRSVNDNARMICMLRQHRTTQDTLDSFPLMIKDIDMAGTVGFANHDHGHRTDVR